MSTSTLPILHLSFPPHDQPITSLLPATLLASQPITTVTSPPINSPPSPPLPSPSFSGLVSTPASSSPLPSADVLKQLHRVLVAGAPVVLGVADASAANELQNTLVLSGFTSVRQRSEAGLVVLETTKPAWAAGASAKLSFARKTPAPATAATTAATSTWNLSGGSLAEDDLMVDEDDLLARETERVEARPKAVAADCGTGGAGRQAKGVQELHVRAGGGAECGRSRCGGGYHQRQQECVWQLLAG